MAGVKPAPPSEWLAHWASGNGAGFADGGRDDEVDPAGVEFLDPGVVEVRGARLILFDLDLGDGFTVEWALGWAVREPGCRLVASSSVQGAFPFKQLQVELAALHGTDDFRAAEVSGPIASNYSSKPGRISSSDHRSYVARVLHPIQQQPGPL